MCIFYYFFFCCGNCSSDQNDMLSRSKQCICSVVAKLPYFFLLFCVPFLYPRKSSHLSVDIPYIHLYIRCLSYFSPLAWMPLNEPGIFLSSFFFLPKIYKPKENAFVHNKEHQRDRKTTFFSFSNIQKRKGWADQHPAQKK